MEIYWLPLSFLCELTHTPFIHTHVLHTLIYIIYAHTHTHTIIIYTHTTRAHKYTESVTQLFFLHLPSVLVRGGLYLSKTTLRISSYLVRPYLVYNLFSLTCNNRSVQSALYVLVEPVGSTNTYNTL